MPAYVISEVEFFDRELVERYRTLAQATIARYGGRYVVRGGAIETIEGEWAPEKHLIPDHCRIPDDAARA